MPCPLENVVNVSYGPISRCVEDIVLVLKSWWIKKLWTWDNLVVPLEFNNQDYENDKKLKIGYFYDNKVFECANVIKNIINNTVGLLRENGHEAILIDTDIMPKGIELFIRASAASDSSYFLENFQGEEPCWPYKDAYLRAAYPLLIPWLNFWRKNSGYHKSYEHSKLEKSLNYPEFCSLMREINEYRLEFNQYWQNMKLDAVICPIWPLVAPYHKDTIKLAPAFSYAYYWNLLDFPAGVIPIKLIQEGENKYESNVNDAYAKDAQKTMENSVGLPVCIQVVGNTYKDEIVLKVMKIIQDLYQFYHLPSINE